MTLRRRLREQMEAQGVDVLVLLGSANVAYATGHVSPAAEPARAAAHRTTAVLTLKEQVLLRLDLDLEEEARELARVLGDFPGTLAIDEFPMPLYRALADRSPGDASALLSPAKVIKEPDEVERIHRAQSINDEAMADILPLVKPGVRATELTAAFLKRIFELGATQNTVDPIWQVVPPTLAEGPYSNTGNLAFPTVTTDRALEEGDVIWNDTGIGFEGYASDFGRTWLVGREPDDRQRAHFRRWREVIAAVLEVMKPGATGRDMTRAAIDAHGGKVPWLPHFYLAHGIGSDSAELPLVGTDLGEEFDESQVLAPGMVAVLEPVIYEEDGTGGYRGEEVVVITDDGHRVLSDFPYTPYE